MVSMVTNFGILETNLCIGKPFISLQISVFKLLFDFQIKVKTYVIRRDILIQIPDLHFNEY